MVLQWKRRNKCNHGVGIVIRNDLAKHITDIEPTNERLMYITLASTLPINIIVAYMPTSIHSSEEKDKAYDKLQSTLEKPNNKGPTYIVGDSSARLIDPGNSTEEEAMG